MQEFAPTQLQVCFFVRFFQLRHSFTFLSVSRWVHAGGPFFGKEYLQNELSVTLVSVNHQADDDQQNDCSNM